MSGTSASGSGSNKSQPQLTPESKESKLKRLFHFGSKKPPNAFAATPRESRSSVAKGAQAGGAESRTAKIVTRSADAVVKAPISELWNEAWDELQIKEPTLFKEYEEHVDKAVSHSPKSHSVMAAMTATHSSATAFSGLGKLQRAEVMKALLEERIEELKSEQWKIKFGENEFAVKDMVGPVVGVIDWAKEFIGTAADASPYSSIAWAGVSLLLPLVLNPGKQEVTRAKGLEKIAALLRQCSIREALYSHSYDDSMDRKKANITVHVNYRDELKNLYVKILTFQATCLCFLAKRTASKVIRDMVAFDDWDKLWADIQDQSMHMKSLEDQWRDFKVQEQWEVEAGRHKHKMEILAPMGNEISRLRTLIEKAQKEETRPQLLEWLSSEEISTRYNDIRVRHESLTGNWLIKSDLYTSWKTSPGSFLWLHGKAGSGKSYLSSTAIAELETVCTNTPYEALAYYYFSFDQTKQDATNMLSAMIRQLCGRRPDTPDWLLNLGRTFRDKGTRPGLDHLENAIWDAVSGFDAVYLVVDALDECGASQDSQAPVRRATLLKSLAKLQGCCPPNVHVLVTSRKEPDIEAKFSKLLRAPTAKEIDLRHFREAVDHDIGIYIRQRFDSSDFDEISNENKDLAKEILVEKADGMFQYVALQLVNIQNSYSEDIPNLLENLPQGLDATYVRMLKSINPKHRMEAKRILVWVALSIKPLNSKLLAEAAVISSSEEPPFNPSRRLKRLEEPPGLFKLLPSLLIEVKTEKISEIRFAHFSVKEFLMSEDISRLKAVSQYRIQKDKGHMLIAESCLCYHLYASQAKDIAITEDNHLELFPLWGYSAMYWMNHMNAVAEGLWKSALKERAKSVLAAETNNFLRMVQIFDPVDEYRDWGKPFERLAPPLYYISATRNHRIVSLLTEGLDSKQCAQLVNTSTEETFHRPLQVAVTFSDIQMVNLLLDLGAEVNAQGGSYGNVLQAAASNGLVEVVELLLDRGAEVNAQSGHHGNALQAAARNRSAEVVELLLDRGAEVNSQGGFFGNALQAAASNGSVEVVKLLLDRGAEVNAPGGHFGSALEAANKRRKIEVVELLLARGARDNA